MSSLSPAAALNIFALAWIIVKLALLVIYLRTVPYKNDMFTPLFLGKPTFFLLLQSRIKLEQLEQGLLGRGLLLDEAYYIGQKKNSLLLSEHRFSAGALLVPSGRRRAFMLPPKEYCLTKIYIEGAPSQV
ncbi:hypothetical protein ACJX0J_015689 [Zea mays]